MLEEYHPASTVLRVQHYQRPGSPVLLHRHGNLSCIMDEPDPEL